MTILLHVSERARFPFCSGIIAMTGACANAGPFFMSSANGGDIRHGSMALRKGDPIMVPHKVKLSPEIASAKKAGVPRKRVVARLWRTAERQVAEIETRMAEVADDPLALERDAKTLAIIAKTIRDLVAIDGEASEINTRTKSKEQVTHGARANPPASLDATDLGPRDIEGFRAELARRLDELRGERAGSAAS